MDSVDFKLFLFDIKYEKQHFYVNKLWTINAIVATIEITIENVLNGVSIFNKSKEGDKNNSYSLTLFKEE